MTKHNCLLLFGNDVEPHDQRIITKLNHNILRFGKGKFTKYCHDSTDTGQGTTQSGSPLGINRIIRASPPQFDPDSSDSLNTILENVNKPKFINNRQITAKNLPHV